MAAAPAEACLKLSRSVEHAATSSPGSSCAAAAAAAAATRPTAPLRPPGRMGKGGTRFVGDAVAVRGKSKGYTGKDMKKASGEEAAVALPGLPPLPRWSVQL